MLRRRSPARYKDIITACDILIRGLAHVGIVALVDAATGYQEVRERIQAKDERLATRKMKRASADLNIING